MTIGLFIVRRLAALIALLLLVSLLVFSLLWLSPGSTLATLIGTRPATPQTIAAITAEYHLHQGFVAQYLHWLAGAIHLDFGRSIQSGASVTGVIAAHAPVTLELGAYTLVLTVLVGVPAGLLAGIRRDSAIDRSVSGLLVVGFAAPGFAVGIILLYVFGVALGWFPVYGAGNGLVGRIYHLTLPAVAFSIFLTAIVGRQTRAATLDVMERDYIAFARARGLSERRILTRYALRNIAVPVVNAIGVVMIVALSGRSVHRGGVLPAGGRLPHVPVGDLARHPGRAGARNVRRRARGHRQSGGRCAHFGGRRAHALPGRGRPVTATFELSESAAGSGLRRRWRPPALTTAALGFLALVLLCLIAGPLIAPQDPDKQNVLLGAVPPSSATCSAPTSSAVTSSRG